ncbi:MAG: hypothetical protein KIS81_10660 [Maricaulaceae bacterium]|nr:hypothetical protein [Maricaulaceae bacterium]
MRVNFTSIDGLAFAWTVFRARTGAFVRLAVIDSLAAFALTVMFYAMAGAAYAAFTGAVSVDEPAAEAVTAAAGAFIAAAWPVFVIGIIMRLFIEAAWLRLFTRGETGGLLPFRFGPDEVALALSALAVFGVLCAAYIGMTLVLVLPASLAGGFLATLAGAVMLAGLIWLSVRLSPAMALSLRLRAFRVAEAWKGTRGLFWPLFGGFFLAVLASLVLGMLAMSLSMMTGGGANLQARFAEAGWAALVLPFLFQQAGAIISAALMRGVASKAAIAIDEAGQGLAGE